MKVAVTSTGPGLDDYVEPRFGRCPCFLIVETDTMAFEAVENPNVALGGGAGIQSAQLMADRDVQVVLTGNCGPNAFRTLEAAGIQVIVGVGGTAREAVEQLKAGGSPAAAGPNVAGHFGMGASPSAPQAGTGPGTGLTGAGGMGG
ncbi:MAG: NifB/NifX family molybdenum-iron cluster-binding protein, partial [Candidatus Brocadiae bacterium]|nr:NifB/NifX family molybdenum-iron cluster-binding protein [Candidatus Brocadiia bacterium]